MTEKVEKGELRKSKFLRLYTESLTDAISITTGLEGKNDEAVIEALTAVLSLIVSVVASHKHRDRKDINANIMVSVPTSKVSEQDFLAGVKFLQRGMPKSEYSYVLHIVAWSVAGHGVEHGFALAVPKEEDQILFGAPQAFHTGEIQHIPNISAIRVNSPLLEHKPRHVKEAVVAHFRSIKLKSFASLTVKRGKRSPAVLSIQSNKTFVFGVNKEKEEELTRYIRPFVEVLSIILQKRSIASDKFPA